MRLRANWFEPGINPTYRELAAHYGTAILPTRVRRPRDKAKVEAGVLVVERWILARLRNERFFSLETLNAAIWSLVADLNARPMRKLGVSRRQLFDELDRPALSPLPAEMFVYAEWRIRRVSLDYHIDIDGHYYSVPHRLLREQVEARVTARAIGGVKLLILDDWGLEPFGPDQRRDLLEIAEDRHGGGATMMTSQIPVDRWHDLIGDQLATQHWPTPSLIASSTTPNAYSYAASRCERKRLRRRSRLDLIAIPMTHPSGPRATPPRPASIGTAGRLQSEWVAGITPESPADFVGMRR